MTQGMNRRVYMESFDTAFRLEGGSGWLRAEPLPDTGLPRLSRGLMQLSPGSPVIWPAPGGPSDLRLFIDLEPGAVLVPADPESFGRTGDVAGIEAMVEELAIMLQPAVPGTGVEKRLVPNQPFETEEPCGLSAVTAHLWVRPDVRDVRYGDMPALPPLEKGRFVPLTRTLWLEVPAYAELTCLTSECLGRDKLLVDSFRHFLTLTLYQVYEEYSDQYVKDVVRLNREARNKKRTMGETLASAVSVLSKESRTGAGESPMFEAVAHVCSSLGCQPVRPERLPEDPRQQLNRILDVSGMASRWINLNHRWYQQDCGPILAFRKGGPGSMARPVALIRQNGRYRCHIPGQEGPAPDPPLAGNIKTCRHTALPGSSQRTGYSGEISCVLFFRQHRGGGFRGLAGTCRSPVFLCRASGRFSDRGSGDTRRGPVHARVNHWCPPAGNPWGNPV